MYVLSISFLVVSICRQGGVPEVVGLPRPVDRAGSHPSGCAKAISLMVVPFRAALRPDHCPWPSSTEKHLHMVSTGDVMPLTWASV